jgi:hypothetical protein
MNISDSKMNVDLISLIVLDWLRNVVWNRYLLPFTTNALTDKEVNHIRIFCNVNCKTPNVVYLLVCHVSGSQYVGESVQPFNKRMNGHRSDLTKKALFPVSLHFVSTGHSLDDFFRSKIYIIDHNPSWKENQRHTRESFWIRELHTWHPEGINKKAKIFCFFFSYCL